MSVAKNLDVANGLDVRGPISATNFVGSFEGTSTTATNIKGGNAGTVWYNTAPDVTTGLSIGSTGKIIQSTGIAPSWSAITYPSTINANSLVYASENNVLSSITSSNYGILTTGNTGTPSILGGAYGVLIGSQLEPPAWVNGVAGSIMRATGINSKPAWSTATYPNTVTVNSLLYASSANIISPLSTSNNSVLITNTSGVPSLLQCPINNGVLVGSTTSTPLWSNVPFLTGTNFSQIPNTALINSSITIGSTNIPLGGSSSTIVGLTSVSATTLLGNLTGNASTADKLKVATTVNGVLFDGSTPITISAATSNPLTIGNGLSGGSYNGSSNVTIAVSAPNSTVNSLHYPIIATTQGTSVVLQTSSYFFFNPFSGTLGCTTLSANRTLVSGTSTSWGIAPSNGYRTDMGTSSGATWLFYGMSGSTFRSGLQVLDSGLSARLYLNTGYIVFNSDGSLSNHLGQTFFQTNHASSNNTANSLVLRNASGNFSAGTITAALSGNSTTATTLQTSRNINGTSFNGSSDITTASWGTSRTLTIGSSSKPVDGSSNVSWTLSEIGAAQATHIHSASDITSGVLDNARTSGASINTANTLVLRDASGNFSAGNITANLSGNASTATKLATSRTINGAPFDGSANITITANTTNSLSAGSYISGSPFNGSSAHTWTLLTGSSGDWFTKAIVVNASGVSELGRYLDFHSTSSSTTDFDFRLDNQASGLLAASGRISAPYFTSSVESGTAPFAVSSSTKVSNLNVDYLDGYSASLTASANTVAVRDGSANLTINELYASGWLRNTGQTGWYNSTYGAGLYAVASNHISTYNSSILTVSSGQACTSTTSGGLRVVGGGGFGGNIYAGGDIVAFSSDMRLKENIKLIDNAIQKVQQLNGVIYNFNSLANKLTGYDTTIKHSGLLAQEVEKVLPEAVCIAPFDAEDGGIGSKSGEFYKTVKYDKLVPLLIEAIKEQQMKIDQLEQRVNNLV